MAQRIVTRRRRWILIVAAVVVLVIIALNVLSGFYIDLLWFKEVGFQSVFWTIFWTKVALGVIFGVLFFGILYANLLIVRRLVPPFRTFTPEQEVVERYRVAIEPYAKWILPAVSLVIALFVGLGASSQWQSFQMWRHAGAVSFGTPDPVYGRDIGFYVFRLPFLHFVQGWLFSALIGVTVLAAIAHYLWGGIRLQATSERVTPAVKAHLSVLLGLIMLVKAWGYYLGKFDLLFSKRGVVEGASYTDIHAQKPALFILLIIAVICAIVFFVNIRFRGWAAPGIALGLLALVAVVIGAIYPAAVQKLSVEPQEFQREQPFIDRDIAATRDAFGLSAISKFPVSPTPDLTQQSVSDNSATIQNIRLWAPDALKRNYLAQQRIRSYYEFNDVDVDRYQVSGDQRVVMLSGREVSQNGIPSGGQTWQNIHLVYTHGFAAVASQVNTATSNGSPSFLVENIPPVTDQPDFQLSQNGERVYYGELADVPYVVVNSGADELDYQTDSSQRHAPAYTGSGGIQVGGIMGKLLFAWRFKDINLLISGLIHNDSRMLIYRSLQERIPKPAPFLKYDGDPYAAIVDGQLVWIQDAYTTTGQYPYSQSVSLGQLTAAGHLSGTANYIRNSVKVVVNAYSGHMTYYIADDTDPIVNMWADVFPSLFRPLSDASPDLRAHFRYPEDLFTVQAQQFANYHVTDPQVFYGKQDFWQLPGNPSAAATVDLSPYYVQTLVPGASTEQFQLILPFTPAGRQNMVAWMAAGSDPDDYGKLVSFEFPSGENVQGPQQVFNQINADPAFSSQRTLLSRGGSKVVFGDFLVVPIDKGFLYVLPVYVEGNQKSAQTFPQLKEVVVFHGNTVGLGTTLDAALADSFGQAPPPPPPNGGGTGSVPDQIKALLDDAARHFQNADNALKAGDLGTYQDEIAAAEADIQQAQALANGSSSGGGSTPTPTPSGTVSPLPGATSGPSGPTSTG